LGERVRARMSALVKCLPRPRTVFRTRTTRSSSRTWRSRWIGWIGCWRGTWNYDEWLKDPEEEENASEGVEGFGQNSLGMGKWFLI
jgi:hypothetical protein